MWGNLRSVGSLAAGGAPVVQQRGIKLAGCRCAPKPPYAPNETLPEPPLSRRHGQAGCNATSFVQQYARPPIEPGRSQWQCDASCCSAQARTSA